MKFPLSRIPLFDQPKPVKVSIVGIVRGCKSKWVKGARVWYTDIYNPYLSPFLWAVISNVLHEIAQRALLLGAIHVNTDGYIFKSFKAFCSMRDFIEDNELPYKSGIGDGVVTGLNSYYISSVPTVKATEELTKSRPKNNIIVPKRSDFNWLDYWQSTRKKENE